jgi:methylamine methyltransferase corrinoid protein reductive activase
MMYKSGFLEQKENCLVTDYGTNAEMALKVGDEIYTGSAAAGPAMEGQSIEYGVLASPGSISDVDINEDGTWNNIVLDDKLVPIVTSKVNPATGETVKVLDYKAKGITGTGVVSCIAEGLKSGVIPLPGIDTPDQRIHLVDGVYISQKDVREAGKAMGAIRAGHRTLMYEVGLSDAEVIRQLLNLDNGRHGLATNPHIKGGEVLSNGLCYLCLLMTGYIHIMIKVSGKDFPLFFLCHSNHSLLNIVAVFYV